MTHSAVAVFLAPFNTSPTSSDHQKQNMRYSSIRNLLPLSGFMTFFLGSQQYGRKKKNCHGWPDCNMLLSQTQ